MNSLVKVVKKISLKLTVVMLLLVCVFAQAEDEQTWKINLKDAEIRAFITQVADITEKSFVIDPRVKGKVTVISHSSLSKDEVYELFLAVLHVHNFAAVPSVDGLVKIVPNNTATKDTIPLDSSSKAKGEELVTRVIPVKNTPANELIPVLRPMVAQYGSLAAVPSANAIIISDHGANIERILSIIDKIDGAESEEIEVVQLKEAWVTDIVALLENLTPVETGSARGARGKSTSNSTARVRVVADERTNRLILKGEKSARTRVRQLVEKLDTPAETTNGSTKVIYLRFAEAKKVAEILTSLISKNSQISGPASKSLKSAEDLSRTATFIQADETLNALVIKADPASMEDLQDIIRQLDVRRSQVLIEAAIIEVKGDVGRALGVQWGFGDSGHGAPVGGVSFSDFGNSLNNVGASVLAAQSGTPSASAPSLSDGLSLAGGKFNSKGDFSFGAFLQAVASTSNTNILSTPSIVTLDNEEAEIIVGQEVPITTGSTTNTGSGTLSPFTTTERKDVGLTLKVTPHIHEGNSIRLDIDQQSSDLSTSAKDVEAGLNTITTKRSIKTTILAEDKEYIVLGGLVQEDDNKKESKVPLLGDLPFLGVLFKSSQVQREKKNLMVFLKPTILRDPQTAGAVSSGKYQKLRELQLNIDKRNGSISISKDKLLPDDIQKIWVENPGAEKMMENFKAKSESSSAENKNESQNKYKDKVETTGESETQEAKMNQDSAKKQDSDNETESTETPALDSQ